MSENTTKQETTTREKYELKVEPMAFEADYSGKYMSSIDFCKLVNECMRAAFADFIGCTFDVNQGIPSVSLYFTHAEVDGVRAVNRLDKKESGSTLLDKTRSRDLLFKEGDRYAITDDGIDVIMPLLMPRAYNGGKPSWKNLVTDIVDRNTGNIYQPQQPQQITKVSSIDPRNICQLIFGKKDGENFVDYGVKIVGDLTIRNGLMPGSQAANYAISIDKAYNGNLQKTYEKFGIATAGSSIIR